MQLLIKVLFFVLFSLSAQANFVGSDFQNFNPTYSGLDFITVHSSETLEPCILNTGLYFNQAYNSLPFFESVDFDVDEFRNRSNYSDTVSGFDFNLGYGILKDWDVGVNIQSIVNQNVETDQLISGSFEETGMTEFRLNTKVRTSGDNRGGSAVIASVNFNTIENNIFLGEGAGPTFNLEFAMDTTINKFNLALNLGHRWRQEGEQIEAGVVPFGDAFIYSTALSILLSDKDLKLVGEIFGSYPTASEIEVDDKARSNLEALLGLKYDQTSSFSLVGGVGSEILSGTATPDWRFFAGLNWALDCCGDEPQLIKRPKPKPMIQVDLNVEDDLDFDVEPPKPIADETFVSGNINFQFGSYKKVYPNTQKILEKLAEYLKERDFSKLIVEGHTDSVGSDAFNLDLSKQRSRAIAFLLVKRYGLDRDKVRFRYFGERRPIADNGNFQGRKRNRRVEFQIFY